MTVTLLSAKRGCSDCIIMMHFIPSDEKFKLRSRALDMHWSMYLVLSSFSNVSHQIELLVIQVLVVEDVIEVVHAAVDDEVHSVWNVLGQDSFLVSRRSLLLDGLSLTPVNFLDSVGDQTGDGFGLCPAIREI